MAQQTLKDLQRHPLFKPIIELDEDAITLSDNSIDEILDALDAEEFAKLDKLVAELDPAEMAALLDKSSKQEAAALLAHLQGTIPAEVFAYVGSETMQLALKVLKPRQIGAIIAELDTDDAIDLLEDFDADERRAILRYVSKHIRALVEEGLTYPEDSAGRMMHREFVAVPPFWTVGKTLDYLQAVRDDLPDELYDIYVVDPLHHVVGQVPLGRLIRVARQTKVSTLARDQIFTVPATTDQEDVAHIFRRATLTTLAVVDADKRLIGVITVDDVVNVVDEEAQEDLLRLAGVPDTDIYQAAFSTAQARFRWLSLNLLTAIVASVAIGLFSTTIEQIVALAVLMPIVASMGGNAGTQTLTVVVRALAMRELSATNAVRVVIKESLVGLMNGCAFAVITGAIAGLWFNDIYLGLVIGMAMVANLVAAGLAGALIPLTLNKFKIDPALASSVFLTTVTDVVGFVAFLGLATLMLL
jgi:magnesium transporter